MIAQNLKQHMVDCLRAAIETINSDMPDRDILIGLYAAERSLVFDRRSIMRQTGMEAGGLPIDSGDAYASTTASLLADIQEVQARVENTIAEYAMTLNSVYDPFASDRHMQAAAPLDTAAKRWGKITKEMREHEREEMHRQMRMRMEPELPFAVAN